MSENEEQPPRAPFDLRDVAGAVGLLMVGAGVWLISMPAALIVVGVLLMAIAVASARIR